MFLNKLDSTWYKTKAKIIGKQECEVNAFLHWFTAQMPANSQPGLGQSDGRSQKLSLCLLLKWQWANTCLQVRKETVSRKLLLGMEQDLNPGTGMQGVQVEMYILMLGQTCTSKALFLFSYVCIYHLFCYKGDSCLGCICFSTLRLHTHTLSLTELNYKAEQ